jgi:hypothetical protein
MPTLTCRKKTTASDTDLAVLDVGAVVHCLMSSAQMQDLAEQVTSKWPQICDFHHGLQYGEEVEVEGGAVVDHTQKQLAGQLQVLYPPTLTQAELWVASIRSAVALETRKTSWFYSEQNQTADYPAEYGSHSLYCALRQGANQELLTQFFEPASCPLPLPEVVEVYASWYNDATFTPPDPRTDLVLLHGGSNNRYHDDGAEDRTCSGHFMPVVAEGDMGEQYAIQGLHILDEFHAWFCLAGERRHRVWRDMVGCVKARDGGWTIGQSLAGGDCFFASMAVLLFSRGYRLLKPESLLRKLRDVAAPFMVGDGEESPEMQLGSEYGSEGDLP